MPGRSASSARSRASIRAPHSRRSAGGVAGAQRQQALPLGTAPDLDLGEIHSDRPAQNRPVMRPSASTSILFAAGTRGSPGIVMMSPQIATTNSAPADSRTSRTPTMWPLGAPLALGSVVKLNWVLAMQTGKWPKP